MVWLLRPHPDAAGIANPGLCCLGMEKLQKSMSVYVKWNARKCDGFEDKERNTPIGFMARSMTTHGEDYEEDSEFGNCLVSLGQANERIAALQDAYLDTASATWLDHLERTVATMKEYQVCDARSLRSIKQNSVISNALNIGFTEEARKPPSCIRCQHHETVKGKAR